ncbi:MAG: acyl-CoA dehydrogenase domain-containing protein, partial [Pseudomonadota bacterium]
PLVEWCLQTTLHDLQQQMQRLIDNFPVRLLCWPLRLLVFPFGVTGLGKPDDPLGSQVAASIVEDTPVRDRITRGVYLPASSDDSLGRVLNAFRLANQTQPLRDRLHAALRKRDPDQVDQLALLMGHQRRELVDWAVANGIIGQDDHAPLLEALNTLYDVIRVDAFDADAIKTMADQVRGQYRVVVRQ